MLKTSSGRYFSMIPGNSLWALATPCWSAPPASYTLYITTLWGLNVLPKQRGCLYLCITSGFSRSLPVTFTAKATVIAIAIVYKIQYINACTTFLNLSAYSLLSCSGCPFWFGFIWNAFQSSSVDRYASYIAKMKELKPLNDNNKIPSTSSLLKSPPSSFTIRDTTLALQALEILRTKNSRYQYKLRVCHTSWDFSWLSLSSELWSFRILFYIEEEKRKLILLYNVTYGILYSIYTCTESDVLLFTV